MNQYFIPFYGMYIVYTYHNFLIHSTTDGHLSHFYLWKWKKVKVAQSCPTLCDLMDCPWNSPGQNTGVGSLFLLQGIFPTQGLKPGLPHCRWTLYQLSNKGSPRTLEWVAYPFFMGIFPTQESTWGLPHCKWILYQLSYQGSPFPLWVLWIIVLWPFKYKFQCE